MQCFERVVKRKLADLPGHRLPGSVEADIDVAHCAQVNPRQRLVGSISERQAANAQHASQTGFGDERRAADLTGRKTCAASIQHQATVGHRQLDRAIRQR